MRCNVRLDIRKVKLYLLTYRQSREQEMTEFKKFLATRSAEQREELQVVLGRRFRKEEDSHQHRMAAETSYQLFLVEREIEAYTHDSP